VNGKRTSRSHHVGPGGIRCVCCRPANKALSKRIAAREQRRIARAELAALEVDATRSASDEQSLSAYIEDLHESLVGGGTEGENEGGDQPRFVIGVDLGFGEDCTVYTQHNRSHIVRSLGVIRGSRGAA